jgi:outer membrane protein TolC
VKHVRALTRLAGLGEPAQLADAWRDHRQEVPGTLEEAGQQVNELLGRRPDLLVRETYSAVVTACDRCRDRGPFHRVAPDVIVGILGYW